MIHQRPLVVDGGADWLPRRIKRRALSTDTWGYLNTKLLLRHWQLAPGTHILRLPSPDDSQVAVTRGLFSCAVKSAARLRETMRRVFAVSGCPPCGKCKSRYSFNDAIATEGFYMSFLARHQNSARGASLTRSPTCIRSALSLVLTSHTGRPAGHVTIRRPTRRRQLQQRCLPAPMQLRGS